CCGHSGRSASPSRGRGSARPGQDRTGTAGPRPGAEWSYLLPFFHRVNERLLVDLVARELAHDAAVGHDQDAGTDGEQVAGVGRGDDQGQPGLGPAGDELVDGLPGADVDPGGGFA